MCCVYARAPALTCLTNVSSIAPLASDRQGAMHRQAAIALPSRPLTTIAGSSRGSLMDRNPSPHALTSTPTTRCAMVWATRMTIRILRILLNYVYYYTYTTTTITTTISYYYQQRKLRAGHLKPYIDLLWRSYGARLPPGVPWQNLPNIVTSGAILCDLALHCAYYYYYYYYYSNY
jgi:hypothetical protein